MKATTYYIVMELVDGPSLGEIIASDGKLPEPVAIDYAAQICNGLAYAHRQGLLHRDIKPANILITKDDVVKLSDFGIARAMSQQTMAMTRPGLIMGSVYYLSPEQAQGHELHETSDLYSVGVVLYQMLMGRLPYTGDSPVTVALKHVSDPVPVIDPESSGVSPALASIVNRLLQKQPEHRFQSASEVASALREARERPAVATYSTHDDSPAEPITGPLQPPPRPSRLPDRPTDMDEEPRPRSVGPYILFVIAALVIATAAAFFLTRPGVPRVTLDNYVGMTDAQAQQAVVNAGLDYKISRQTSATVAPNHVISQDPGANSSVAKGSTIALVISSGKPVVGLRDVTGYTVSDAQKDLAFDTFQIKMQHKYDPSPKDTVIAEKPKPGTKLRQGSTVTLVVSDGPAPIKMPHLVGLKLDKARAIAGRDGFTINITETGQFNNIPSNVIEWQDVPAGSMIPSDHSQTVNVVVSTGGGLASVPNVVNAGFVNANQTLLKAGFTVDITYMIHPASADNGLVVQQDPAGNTPLEKGSSVKIMVSVPGEVPDTEGMDLQSAKNTLMNAGYTPGNITLTTEGAGGKVVRTEPFAGTPARPGAEVSIYVNSASAQPPQP